MLAYLLFGLTIHQSHRGLEYLIDSSDQIIYGRRVLYRRVHSRIFRYYRAHRTVLDQKMDMLVWSLLPDIDTTLNERFQPVKHTDES